ncbi:hypothetical protein [Pseudokineococcus sp. 1T1Z-3]|uniref:hypothetical protein n=1 Tax=Pseudokineococcus sp. 1T1Z-3 TaxID=3132745 RepID=UPI0030AD856A
MTGAPEGPPPPADPDEEDPLAGPRPGCARPVVGGLVLLLVATLLATVDDSVAGLLAVALAAGGVFLVLGGLFFLLSNVDEALRAHLLRQRTAARDGG